jgi:hypothetical protein
VSRATVTRATPNPEKEAQKKEKSTEYTVARVTVMLKFFGGRRDLKTDYNPSSMGILKNVCRCIGDKLNIKIDL